MLSGDLFEDDSAVVANGTGSAVQRLTFTAGTGAFTGATGVVTGEALLGTTGFTTSGSGTLSAAGVSAPEPASIALLFGGLGSSWPPESGSASRGLPRRSDQRRHALTRAVCLCTCGHEPASIRMSAQREQMIPAYARTASILLCAVAGTPELNAASVRLVCLRPTSLGMQPLSANWTRLPLCRCPPSVASPQQV